MPKNPLPSAGLTRRQRIQVIALAAAAVGMFGFAFALVPLYNVMCKSLGINGKTAGAAPASGSADLSRWVKVQFVTGLNSNMPWTFKPLTRSVRVHPGENKFVHFFSQNNSNHTMVIQAIPSVSPGLAAKYFKKTQCFCFVQHTFKAHQSMKMPLLFHIDKKLPKNIHEITLSYTLFDLTKAVQTQQGKNHDR